MNLWPDGLPEAPFGGALIAYPSQYSPERVMLTHFSDMAKTASIRLLLGEQSEAWLNRARQIAQMNDITCRLLAYSDGARMLYLTNDSRVTVMQLVTSGKATGHIVIDAAGDVLITLSGSYAYHTLRVAIKAMGELESIWAWVAINKVKQREVWVVLDGAIPREDYSQVAHNLGLATAFASCDCPPSNLMRLTITPDTKFVKSELLERVLQDGNRVMDYFEWAEVTKK